MMRTPLLIAATLALVPASLAAQPPAPAPMPTGIPIPDAAHIAAARTLIATVFPQSRRDDVVNQMVQGLMGAIAGTIAQSPGMQDALKTKPAVQKIVKDFLGERVIASRAMVTSAMPEMATALEKAYARRFSVEQMTELNGFFQTPTGKLYVERSPSIMTDPDVVQWQQQITKRTMEDAQRDAPSLTAKLKAAMGTAAPKKKG